MKTSDTAVGDMIQNDPSVIERLRKLDSCAVSDALDKLSLAGYVGGMHCLATNRRIAGRARTVKLVKKPPVTEGTGPARHLGATAVELSGPDDVILVEQRTGLDCGSWGGLLSLGAKLKGVAGIVVDGPVRDVDEAQQLDLPVYGRSATARTARGRIVEAGTDVPIMIGSVEVAPGDYVIADASAVVIVPAARIAEVLDTAETIARLEFEMAKALLGARRSDR